MREMVRAMSVVYVAYPTKVAALHARSQATIVHSVGSQCAHLQFLSLTIAQYGVNVVTSSICTVS